MWEMKGLVKNVSKVEKNIFKTVKKEVLFLCTLPYIILFFRLIQYKFRRKQGKIRLVPAYEFTTFPEGAADMLDLKNAGLTELLHDFYTLTGLKLCIFDTDFEECASTPIKLYPLCARMRENPEFERRCHSCDTAHMQTCRRTRKPVQYRCHAGLTEYLAPLYYEGVIVAFICIGQATNGRDAELNTIAAYAAQFGIDEEECRSLYNMQLHYSPDEIKAACNILDACISHIYHQRMLEVRNLDTAQQIEKYINDNIAWDLSIEHLCAHFSVSRAELYQIFHTSFNSSVADYIRSKRISMAEQMIRSTSMQISEIASNVGFYDYNYFSKVFHRKFGCSPREYRKKLESGSEAADKKYFFRILYKNHYCLYVFSVILG